MKLIEEFKLYENMWGEETEAPTLTEARSSAEIRAEIEKLKQELKLALAAEKGSKNKKEPVVYIWNRTLNGDIKDSSAAMSRRKGNKLIGKVFETKDAAIEEGNNALERADIAGMLEAPYTKYKIDIAEVLISEVPEETLQKSGLAHLINN